MVEFQTCRENARNNLEARGCEKREWFAGKLEMIREIEAIEASYHKLIMLKEGKTEYGKR